MSPMPAASAKPLATCAALLGIYTCLAWRAAQSKCPSFDEPYHALSAWTSLRFSDYRLDCEDPPLWKYWLALPNGRDALSADFSAPDWTAQLRQMWRQWDWTNQTLYHTAGNDSDRFIRRSRAMMLILAVLLGAVIGWWAWRIAGATAAVVAVFLFCFDPNFLAHGPLVKNDVVFSLAMLSICFALWLAGQKLTWLRLAAILILCPILLTVKFSGPLGAILIPVLLGFRALMRSAWPVMGRSITARFSKFAVAVAVTALAWIIGYAGIWAGYGFRFAPTPQPDVRLNTAELANMAMQKESMLNPAAKPAAAVRILQFCEQRHLLPQAAIAGMLFTFQSALIRPAFLLGKISMTGWWYYFPFAMLVKTPLATLAAAIAAAVFLISRRPRGWTTICLLAPFYIYFASAMASDFNIGIRHLLPIYPLIFIAIGAAASAARKRWGGPITIALVLVAAALASESLSVYPNYIPFFNLAAGGASNGINLLGDSNLDWGQDLLLLRDWQNRHPDVPLYLSYFGSADPEYYGIRAVTLPGGYPYDGPASLPDRPCTLAISATYLQGLYVKSDLYSQFYRKFLTRKPVDVLGGSIYLYNFP